MRTTPGRHFAGVTSTTAAVWRIRSLAMLIRVALPEDKVSTTISAFWQAMTRPENEPVVAL
jgi:hypothetical protein